MPNVSSKEQARSGFYITENDQEENGPFECMNTTTQNVAKILRTFTEASRRDLGGTCFQYFISEPLNPTTVVLIGDTETRSSITP